MVYKDLFLGTLYGGERSLKCPVCGHLYSHIREVYTELGRDEYEAAVYRGTQVGGTTRERRSALAIVIDGECEHSWIMRIQQHKGGNQVEVETIFNGKEDDSLYHAG